MIEADDFLIPARERGFDFFTGVPCSFLTPLINKVVSDGNLSYLPAASEGEAVAIAAGAWLAGRETVVMFQNSGLGNAVNPLTSLNYPFRIPSLVITTWRGGPGLSDEPQHDLMGAITPDLLDVMRIPHQRFPSSVEAVAPALDEACAYLSEQSLPFAFVMEKGSVNDKGMNADPMPAGGPGKVHDHTVVGEAPTRMSAMETLVASAPDSAVVVATTGKCGRELFTIADRAQHLYQVGSMGCAPAMGLGIALNADCPVVVLDGDGAALMKLGSMGTIGSSAPRDLIHVVLDNGTYDSTGGQPTTAPAVRFAKVAVACGYRAGWEVNGLAELSDVFTRALGSPGPHLIHMKIAPGSIENLGRPSVKPRDVARRFRQFLTPHRRQPADLSKPRAYLGKRP